MKTVIIIGGGAAGLFAAYAAAKNNNHVILLEKNEKLGKKIYITGKGRCNLTNDCEPEEYIKNVVKNPKFTYGAINSMPPSKVMDFFEENGLKLKVERGRRVFPVSDKASDVTKTLEKAIISLGVDVRLNIVVKALIVNEGVIKGVCTDKGSIMGDSVIVCTGGVSYPLTGSTGDGYKFAESVGHTVVPPKPALVGIELLDGFLPELQGLSLKNVKLTAKRGEKIIYSDTGEMLFTHFGISGPIVLSCSSFINTEKPNDIKLFIDFKPA
ncbi:MAG: aminoacetone oxidase family FAD-binding enzyme, partial [Clostridia bacterium]|nr:aminoacetone oxidase family FAD-binding enzyme [Clostridia bacterium]